MTSRLIFYKMLERALRAAAYGAIGVIAASASGLASFDVLTADWRTILGAAGGMFVLSILGSFTALPVGPEGPGLVATPTAPQPLQAVPVDQTTDPLIVIPPKKP